MGLLGIVAGDKVRVLLRNGRLIALFAVVVFICILLTHSAGLSYVANASVSAHSEQSAADATNTERHKWSNYSIGLTGQRYNA